METYPVKGATKYISMRKAECSDQLGIIAKSST